MPSLRWEALKPHFAQCHTKRTAMMPTVCHPIARAAQWEHLEAYRVHFQIWLLAWREAQRSHESMSTTETLSRHGHGHGHAGDGGGESPLLCCKILGGCVWRISMTSSLCKTETMRNFPNSMFKPQICFSCPDVGRKPGFPCYLEEFVSED